MLRKGFFDIEVYSPDEFPLPEKAEHPICSNTIYDSFTDVYYSIIIDPYRVGQIKKEGNWHIYYVKDEQYLFFLSIKLMRFMNFDIFGGFYSDNFDIPYFFNRANNLELKNALNSISPLNYVNIRGKSVSGLHLMDLILLDKKIKKRTSYTLENIATEENLSVKKSEKHEDIMEIYRTDKDRFAKYNKIDVEILTELDKKNKIIDFFENTRTFAGLNDINESLRNSVIVDTIALRKANREGFILPSKPSREEKEEDNNDDRQGAFVKIPPPGIHKNVIVLDMAKFYPKILGLLNLSPETILDSGLTKEQVEINKKENTSDIFVEYEEGVYARISTEKEGFIPSLYQEFLKERLAVESEMKKHKIDSPEYNFLSQKRQVVKDTSNSLTGTTGYTGFRLYNPIIYNSIIYTGRRYIIKTEKMIEDLGHDDIYSDTDSRHIEIKKDISDEDLVKLGYELSEKFSKAYVPMIETDFNLKVSSAFEIDFEKSFKTIIYIRKDDGTPAKKRYGARCNYEKGKFTDYLYVRGFDIRRSDASNYCKDIQEQVLRLILWEKPREEVISYVKNMIDGFKKAPIGDISIPKGINKMLEDYGKPNKNGKRGTMPAQISGAKYSNEVFHTNFSAGSKIKYLYVKKMPHGFPPTKIISFDDISKLPNGIEVDYEKMQDANIRKKIERILSAAGIFWNEIDGKKSLFDS